MPRGGGDMLRITFGALGALLLLAGAGPAQAPLPLPVNGDFTNGSLNWGAEGYAAVSAGQGLVGQPGCFGGEAAFVIGRLATIAGVPLAKGFTVAYDYTIVTSDADLLDALRLVAISPATGERVALDIFNPNPAPGTCGTFAGQRTIVVPQLNAAAFTYARLEFHVWGDGEGDLFHAAVDNVQLSA